MFLHSNLDTTEKPKLRFSINQLEYWFSSILVQPIISKLLEICFFKIRGFRISLKEISLKINRNIKPLPSINKKINLEKEARKVKETKPTTRKKTKVLLISSLRLNTINVAWLDLYVPVEPKTNNHKTTTKNKTSLY